MTTMKVIKVISENNARPSVKRRMFLRMCEITRSWPECLTAVVLDDVDLQSWTSKVEHIVAFTAIHLDILFAECTDSLLRGDGHVATKLAIGEACRTFILRGDVCHGLSRLL